MHIQLTGEDGNRFLILGTVQKALREARMADDEVFQFYASASGCIGGLGALYNS